MSTEKQRTRKGEPRRIGPRGGPKSSTTRSAMKSETAAVIEFTRHAKAGNQLRNPQDQLRFLASVISFAEELERQRIAAELHDGVIQLLGMTRIKLGVLRDALGASERPAVLDELQELTEETIRSSRSLVLELSPPILYESGLESAVAWLAERLQEARAVVCNVRDDRQAKPLDKHVQMTLFQAVRELLTNVGKHADATRIEIELRRETDHILICIEDNGVGFDKSPLGAHAFRTGGFGLSSIRERLRLLGGHLCVDSSPGKGTRVSLSAPLKAQGRS